MKAVIFNSGLGKRMGELTANNPKSMVKLNNGETIFERQIRLLSEEGIKDFIITTGPFEEQLIKVSKKKEFKNLNFVFVNNPVYDKTNYIYSMYLAKDYIDDDVILLHGDLVFNRKLIRDIIDDNRENLATVNHSKTLPEKDFKARIKNGFITEVSVNIFDDDCVAFQPLYKLSKEKVKKWLNEVSNFINEGKTLVYAENAFNQISNSMYLEEFSYEDYFVDEVDNKTDLERVSNEIKFFDYREQNIIETNNYRDYITCLSKKYGVTKLFIVGGNSFANHPLKKYLDESNIPYYWFNNFKSNPVYEDVIKGIKAFNINQCDYIISCGGGSAIDVAKCIKLYHNLNLDEDLLLKEIEYNGIKHLSIPTTAGTGSESTRFAVIYKDNKKQSITHDSIIPNDVILDYNLLRTLPDYQKKSTLLDALSQAIESYWSINSTEESKEYAKVAITLILNNINGYINCNEVSMKSIMLASNLAGKAINITQTTAAHAMSYKITSMYGISHGHAVALCIPSLMRYMERDLVNCSDSRGILYLMKTFKEICDIFKVDSLSAVADYIENLINEMGLYYPVISEEDLTKLVDSVNVQRLKNNPIRLDNNDIKLIYKKVASVI